MIQSKKQTKTNLDSKYKEFSELAQIDNDKIMKYQLLSYDKNCQCDNNIICDLVNLLKLGTT